MYVYETTPGRIRLQKQLLFMRVEIQTSNLKLETSYGCFIFAAQ